MPIKKIEKKNIRIFVADDNEPMREKLLQFLKIDFEIVGSASDGKAAFETIMLIKPDIAVLDISMPNMTGIEVTAKLKKNEVDTKVVILTVHEDPDFVRSAFDAGALGYVIKSDLATDLTKAISAVCEGKNYISPNCTLYQS
jgi:DNA-binding NarL/FixJ family response regulator